MIYADGAVSYQGGIRRWIIKQYRRQSQIINQWVEQKNPGQDQRTHSTGA
jgi:hypothetical protein